MKTTIKTVVKRSGKKQGFDMGKIVKSVRRAGKDTKEYGIREARDMMKEIERELGKLGKIAITVEEIRNVVEPLIAQAGFFKTAKHYILYSNQKPHYAKASRGRPEPQLTEVAREVVAKRYLRTDMDGKVLETPGEMFWRVAHHMAKAEITWGSNGIVEETASQFFERMVNFKFVCAGKAMFEAGNPGGTGQLSSCFVLPIEDSIETIFKTLGEAAVVHKNNGGTGFNFSKIRPHGDKVKNVPKASSGPVDFLRAYSAALSQILQGAKRQGANIAILNADHPDIEEFIRLKSEDGTIKNFNISVGVTNAFMEAVVGNKDWELKNPRNGEVWKTVKARKLFDLIAESAWATGDPGLCFLDRLEEDNPTPALGKLEATNPCGEIPLLPYESCNLTSIVLNNHLVEKKGTWEIDWEDLEKSVKLGIRFLDDMIEMNAYPLEAIRQMVKEGNRRIGLGVMGFAHMLYRMGIPYNSNEAVRMSERLAKFIRQKAEETSLQLARERGAFPNFDRSVYTGSAERYRNCALLMIAPTGTTSLVANASSGIEPVFSLVTVRRSFNEDNRKNAPTKEFMLVDPELERLLDELPETRDQKPAILKKIVEHGLQDVRGLPKWMYKTYVTTHEVEPEWHVKIQAAWQKWIDNSVSKTINFAHGATVQDVKDAYLLGWRLGLKGITIYRDGSKMDQVLNVAGKEGKRSKDATIGKETCPECGGACTFADGCVSCPNCGWSKCSM
jgi:ribonucleoside-diphosphate reductase alpha chain